MTPVDRRLTRPELLLAIVVAVAISIAWVALANAYGALGIARNDDWSYLQNAFRFADTGVFAVGGWVQMMLIGQLVLAAPIVWIVGPSVAALQILVNALGVLTLVAAYSVLRNFLDRTLAAIGTLTLASSALYGLLSVSFMTDLPAAAFQLLTLALAYRALRSSRVSWVWLASASATGVFAISIREYAVVALGAVWLVTWRRVRGTGDARVFWAWTVIVALLVVALYLWRVGQVTVPDSRLGINFYGFRYLPWWPLIAGWLLLPALAAVNPKEALRRAWSASRVLTFVAVLATAMALTHTRLGFLGNYLSISGGYTEVIRGVPEDVLPSWWSLAMVVTAAYGSFVLAVVVVPLVVHAWSTRAVIAHNQGSSTSLVATFLTLTVFVYAVTPGVADVALFDRYFIAVLPIAAGLLLWWVRRENLSWSRPLAPMVGALAASTITSVVLVAATSAVDAARWRLGYETARELAVAEGNIDAGFDYYNFNTNGGPRPDGARWTWWTAQLDDRAVCATVTFADFRPSFEAAGPDPTTAPISEVVVAVPLANDQRIVVFHGPDSC